MIKAMPLIEIENLEIEGELKCEICDEVMGHLKMITFIKFSQALPQLISWVHPEFTMAQFIQLKQQMEKDIWFEVNRMCVECGVDVQKNTAMGLGAYMVDYFFHKAWEWGLWDRD